MKRLGNVVCIRATALLLAALLAGCAATPLDNAALESETFESHVENGQRHWNAGEYERATDAYQQALALQDRADIRKALGLLALSMSRFSQARAYLEPLVRDNPEDLNLRENYAITLLKQQDIKQAEAQFLAIHTLSPDRPATLNYLGVISDLQGDYAAAGDYYQKALSLQPNNAIFNNNYGYSRLMLGDFIAAEHWFRQALEQNPDQAERITNNLAIAYARQGQYEKAITLLSATGDEPSVLNNIGYVALLNGDYRSAIAYLERAIELSPSYYARAAANLELARKSLDKSESDS
ncbi:tetratricopeptide repeat protein [Litorivivens sp.]|uniref:tetratricopeptide repeat protein n=1 Tax=Litorivivens sp. TaxID=2020868 RepID=UPI00356AC326